MFLATLEASRLMFSNGHAYGGSRCRKAPRMCRGQVAGALHDRVLVAITRTGS
jgi:hypothetical protein